jgi:hypothetical protein
MRTSAEDQRERTLNVCFRSIEAIARKNKNIHKLFFAVAKKLAKIFPISTAILVTHSKQDNQLRIVDVKKAGYSAENLALIVPNRNSFLYMAYVNQEACHDFVPDIFDGNFLERKLLIDENTKTLAILPLNNDGYRAGLLCLASDRTSAFRDDASFLNSIARKLGDCIAGRTG